MAEGDSEVEEASSVSRSIRFPSGILGGSGGLTLGGVSLARTSSPTSIGLLFLDLLLAGALPPPPSPSPSPRLSSGAPRLPSRRESAACGADTVFLRDGLVRGEGGGGGSFGSCWYDFTDMVLELLLSVSSRLSRLRGESRIQSRHAHLQLLFPLLPEIFRSCTCKVQSSSPWKTRSRKKTCSEQRGFFSSRSEVVLDPVDSR